jgi:predicted ArsR family transcriptional regulator
MLGSIIKLLQERGAITIQEIALALEIDPGALKPMLDMLVSKGKIMKVELPCKTGCAGGCATADSMNFYKAV